MEQCECIPLYHHLPLYQSAIIQMTELTTVYVPDPSQEPVAFLAAAAILLPLASLEMLSCVVFVSEIYFSSLICLIWLIIMSNHILES